MRSDVCSYLSLSLKKSRFSFLSVPLPPLGGAYAAAAARSDVELAPPRSHEPEVLESGSSETRYRTLVQAMSHVVWTRSSTGEFVLRQEGWGAFTGQPFEEYRGWGWLEAVHPDDRLRVKQTWRRTVEARTTYNSEYRLRTADGMHRWVASRAAPVLEADGTVREWIGTNTDIDAAKRAAEERSRLYESERTARFAAERAIARLREATSISDEATAARSLDDMLVTLCERLCAALQADNAMVLLLADERRLVVRASAKLDFDAGESTEVIVGEGFAGQVAASRAPLVLAAVPDVQPHSRCLRERLRSLAGAPLLASGRLVGVLHVGTLAQRDFSEEDVLLMQLVADRVAHAIDRERLLEAERAARAEAEAANRAKMDFLAVMSHELRTPLNAIAGYAELLEMGLRGPLTDEQLADVQSIHRNERHLLSLIDEVLTFAKIDAGRLRLEPENVRLRAALESVSDLIAPQIQQKALEYVLRPCDPNLVVFADLEKLQQVVLNLLSNAVKFTPEGGTITIMASVDATQPERVLVSVRDTGIGIPVHQLHEVFEPFVQLEHGYTRSTEGTGLGLAISRDLARSMGGDLTVTSEAGRGAEFTLALPIVRSGPA
ncbi:MAG TPA: ATP-binding protein [Gemmatimonadaceae bacterium]|nr:ATP-binding protein [Gemmatimonadaceae bacterium]